MSYSFVSVKREVGLLAGLELSNGLALEFLDKGDRPALVGLHQARVIDHIGHENYSKPAFQPQFPWAWRLVKMDTRNHTVRTALACLFMATSGCPRAASATVN